MMSIISIWSKRKTFAKYRHLNNGIHNVNNNFTVMINKKKKACKGFKDLSNEFAGLVQAVKVTRQSGSDRYSTSAGNRLDSLDLTYNLQNGKFRSEIKQLPQVKKSLGIPFLPG